MPKGIMFVQSRPSTPEREDEYNNWYSNEHIPEVLAIDGITSARRFKVHPATPLDDDTPSYCAVYELDADDLGALLGELGARAMDGRMKMSDAMQMDPVPSMVIYELLD
jgi:hypothetical protein